VNVKQSSGESCTGSCAKLQTGSCAKLQKGLIFSGGVHGENGAHMYRLYLSGKSLSAAACTGLLIVALCIVTVPGRASASVGTAAVAPSSIAGGGYENTIALDPQSSTTLAVGGDTSGVEISTNSGSTWTPENAGLYTATNYVSQQELHVASLSYDSSGNLYAAVGNGSSGHSQILELASSATTWSDVATGFTVDGTNGGATGWTDPTRPTGNLFGISGSGTSEVIDAAVEEGVEQKLSGTWSLHSISYPDTAGTTQTVIPTGFALDPRPSSTEGFVTLENQLGTSDANAQLGIWQLSGLGTGTITACHVTAPVNAADPTYEVAATAENTSGTTVYALYVAYGKDGLYRYTLPATGSLNVCSGGNPGTWTPLIAPATNTPAGASACSTDGITTVGGVGTSSGAWIWAGCQDPGAGSGTPPGSNDLWRVKVTYSGTMPKYTEAGIDGGGSASTAATVKSTYPAGTLNPTWWHIDPSPPTNNTSTPRDALGNAGYAPSQIVVSPNGSDVWISGRSGVWRTEDGTATVNASMDFYPIVDGLSDTFDFQAAAEPVNSPNADVVVADHDWRLLASSNNFVTSNPPANDGEPLDQNPDTTNNNFVYAVSFLPLKSGSSGDAALVAGGANGSVEYNTDPFATNAWTALSPVAGSSSDPPVYGLTTGYDSSGNVVIIAASPYAYSDSVGTQGIAVMDCGSSSITGCTSSTAWTYPALGDSSFGTFSPNNMALNLFWPGAARGGQYIYVYDPKTGLWGSRNGGSSWSNVDSTAALPTTMGSAQAAVSGYMTGSGSTLWISEGTDGVFEYSAPNSNCWPVPPGCGGTATRIQSAAWKDPGPLGVDASGDLYETEDSFDTTSGPQFYELNGSTLTGLSGSALAAYQASVLTPSSVALSNSTGSSVYAYVTSAGQGMAVVGPFSP
jgi:hypothetical protein